MNDPISDSGDVIASVVPDDVWVPPDRATPSVGRGKGIRIGWAAGDALDETETPSDPVLPQLSTMLDGPRMGEIFQRELPDGFSEGQLRIERCRVAFVRYFPLRKGAVGYFLEIHDEVEGQRGTQLIYVNCTAKPPSRRRRRLLEQTLDTQPQFGSPFAYLSTLRLVVAAFPNDLRIKHLDHLLDPAKLEGLLRDTLGSSDFELGPPSVDEPPVKIISYKPERSCLVRCGVAPSSVAQGLPAVVFARMYHNDRGEHIYRGMLDVWQSKARCGGDFPALAEPLGYDVSKMLLVQGPVPGTPLNQFSHEERFAAHAATAARGLVAIHGSPAQMIRKRSFEQVLQSHGRAADNLCKLDREVGYRFSGLLERLSDSQPGPPEEGESLVHGDFSLNQLMVDGDKVGIVDFDQVHLGDAAMDIGTFLARLDKRVFEGRVPEAQARRAAVAFRKAYEAARDRPLPDGRVNWYMALAMTGMVLSTRKNLKPGWRKRIDYCIGRAEAMLQGLNSGPEFICKKSFGQNVPT